MKKVLPLLALVALCTLFSNVLSAQSPKVSVQGTLKTSTGTAVDDGEYSVIFKLYTQADGGSHVWTETADVELVGGVYSHLLGSVNAINPSNFANTLFLGVTVGGSELTPRTELTYSPYALSVNTAVNATNATNAVNATNATNAVNATNATNLTGPGSGLTNYDGSGKLFIRTSGTERFTIDASGRVGIGSAGSTIDLAIGDNDTGFDQQGDGELAFITNGSERIRIKPNGRVGIGTNDPQTSLHVAGATNDISSSNANYFHFSFAQGAGTQDGSFFPGIVAFFQGGIAADGNIASAGSVNWSDARTKKVLGLSHAGKDLSLLGKIKITDYQMIDQVQDKQAYKKVIAQEVEEVFPQAVITSRRIIPNVYEQAGAFKFEHGMLTVTTTKAHDFAAGTEIDLVTPEGRLSNIHVTEVKDAHTFTVAAESAPSNVFVYGKYVDDFKSVDYDALSMLNISATQELHRLVQELQKENAALKAENGVLRTQSAGVESRLARLEAMQNSGGTVSKTVGDR